MSLRSRAAQLTQSPSALLLELNGKRLDGLLAHRQPSSGCYEVRSAGIASAASDGYYVALEPLPPGVHTLNFGGILPNLSQAVTYTLVVE